MWTANLPLYRNQVCEKKTVGNARQIVERKIENESKTKKGGPAVWPHRAGHPADPAGAGKPARVPHGALDGAKIHIRAHIPAALAS